jgi:hypothetical protein
LLTSFADTPAQRVVTETDLRLRFIAIARLAYHIRQAMLTIITVCPAGLSVVFERRATVDIVLPLDAI